MSISNISALTVSPSRLQKQKESCRNSHYDGEQKGWDWDKYVALHKEQHAIIVSLTDYGYSGMDNGAKVCNFL